MVQARLTDKNTGTRKDKQPCPFKRYPDCKVIETKLLQRLGAGLTFTPIIPAMQATLIKDLRMEFGEWRNKDRPDKFQNFRIFSIRDFLPPGGCQPTSSH